MTDEVLILMQGTIVRAACERMQSAHLKALSDSVAQAACLPGRFAWDRKAAVHDLAVRVGPVADSIILNSRRRLLDFICAGDADGAAREMERHLSGLCLMGRLAARCA